MQAGELARASLALAAVVTRIASPQRNATADRGCGGRVARSRCGGRRPVASAWRRGGSERHGYSFVLSFVRVGVKSGLQHLVGFSTIDHRAQEPRTVIPARPAIGQRPVDQIGLQQASSHSARPWRWHLKQTRCSLVVSGLAPI